MNLEEIDNMWNEDKTIDSAILETELVNIPNLNHKYYRILVNERLVLNNMLSQYKILLKEKKEFYLYGPTTKPKDTDIKKLPRGTVLKSDADLYVNADEDIIKISKKIAEQEEKINYLTEIVKQINSRQYIIKEISIINKFKAGLN